MKIRGGTRLVNQLLEAAGATPIGMPVPAVSEAISKCVIDGTTIPWEVTTALKVPELVENHTEFAGEALYVLTFALVMNVKAYNDMPQDLRAIIDANSGYKFSVFAGVFQQAVDAPAREIAEELGNNIITVSDTAKWRELVNPIYDAWIADVAEKGVDGQALVDQAQNLMSNECKGADEAL